MNLVEQSLRALDRRGGVTPEASRPRSPQPKRSRRRSTSWSIPKCSRQVSAVGHTHLDVGWLWRVLHTRDKTGRSFATVLA
jgi:alpha-mannosidase